MTTLQWLQSTAAILFTAVLALCCVIPLAAVAGIAMPSTQPLLTVALAQSFEVVGRQLRRAVGDP